MNQQDRSPGRRGLTLTADDWPPPADELRLVVRNSALVGERDRQGSRRLLLVLAAVLFVAFSAMVSLGSRMEMRNLDYRIGELEATKFRLEQDLGGLRGNVAERQSLERVAETAGRRLGLVQPLAGQVIHVYRPLAASATAPARPAPSRGGA